MGCRASHESKTLPAIIVTATARTLSIEFPPALWDHWAEG